MGCNASKFNDNNDYDSDSYINLQPETIIIAMCRELKQMLLSYLPNANTYTDIDDSSSCYSHSNHDASAHGAKYDNFSISSHDYSTHSNNIAEEIKCKIKKIHQIARIEKKLPKTVLGEYVEVVFILNRYYMHIAKKVSFVIDSTLKLLEERIGQASIHNLSERNNTVSYKKKKQQSKGNRDRTSSLDAKNKTVPKSKLVNPTVVTDSSQTLSRTSSFDSYGFYDIDDDGCGSMIRLVAD